MYVLIIRNPVLCEPKEALIYTVVINNICIYIYTVPYQAFMSSSIPGSTGPPPPPVPWNPGINALGGPSSSAANSAFAPPSAAAATSSSSFKRSPVDMRADRDHYHHIQQQQQQQQMSSSSRKDHGIMVSVEYCLKQHLLLYL